MDLTRQWPQLADLVHQSQEIGGLELWGFGSMLKTNNPGDLDVAVIYTDRSHIQELRSRRRWELTHPPIDLIGLTLDENEELRFLESVAAICLL